ncbi:hypothetical protein LguiB_024774 [Lonicera macranthoides]
MIAFSKTTVAREDEQQVEAAEFHGDTLEAILSHVPLIDLVPASQVSRSWNRAVSSSLRHFNRLKPWLIIYIQSSRPPYSTTTRAYDPRSRVWIDINQNPIRYVSALRSSHSNLLYMLSPSKLSFSFDPLHLEWHQAEAPVVWRTDPIVAVVGRRIVVAGGTCDFEEDPLAVEIYDIVSRKWTISESMPAVLKDSSASTWLSIATNDRILFVSEKHTGVTHSFDPERMNWHGPYDLRPNPRILYSVIGFSDDRLILIGLIGDVEQVDGVKLWEVDCESFDCEEIGEMPVEFVKKLESEMFQLSSIGVCMAGNTVYMYNPMQVEEVLICEFVNGGCRWRIVENNIIGSGDRNPTERFVLTCSKVGMMELQRAMRSDHRKFVVNYH